MKLLPEQIIRSPGPDRRSRYLRRDRFTHGHGDSLGHRPHSSLRSDLEYILVTFKGIFGVVVPGYEPRASRPRGVSPDDGGGGGDEAGAAHVDAGADVAAVKVLEERYGINVSFLTV